MDYQPTGNHSQFHGRYNHEVLVYLMKKSGETPRSLAKKANKSKTIIAEALVGECKKIETLWDITTALNGKWEYLFKLDLPESQFRRAVATGR